MDTQRMRSFGLPMLAIAVCTLGSTSVRAESIQAVIRLKETVSMEKLAQSVTDPTSPRYRSYYTPEEIKNLAGPSDADYSSLINQLQSEGVQIVKESPTHLFITVRADRSYLAALPSRSISASIEVANVNGLQKSQARTPRYAFPQKTGTLSSHAVADFTGMTPDQIHSLYGFNTIYKAGFTGKGQHISIATYDGFYVQDVQDYYTKNKLSPGPTVDQVTFNGTPAFDAGSAAETQTDAEFSGMIAQGASIHVFASAENSDAGELAMFTAILDDNRAQVVNYSWGSCEATVDASHKTDMDAVYARAVAQGVNIMVASGDSGSDCAGDGSNSPDWPASNPNVVAIGGTSITNVTATTLAETAWGDGTPTDGASGGGISALYTVPSYQSALGAATTFRSYPDVSFNADPNSGQPTWLHYDPSTGAASAKAQYVVIGGTSIAAPQWSGFLALVGEARGAGKPLGFLNPSVYGQYANQAKYFNDITSGSNGLYSAATGWDAVTGLGSMKADVLFSYLSQI
jgi:kumamolisin